jgi:phosphatidylglycerophosphate synthase
MACCRTRFGRILADSLSLSRIVWMAIVVLGETRRLPLICLGAMIAMSASDVLDGWAARRFGCPSERGAALDCGIDFAALFSITLYHVLTGRAPLFLPVFMLLSFGSFIVRSRIRGSEAAPRIGKASGAVLFAYLSLDAAAKAFVPRIEPSVALIGAALCAFILSLSTLENLSLIGDWPKRAHRGNIWKSKKP